jgi:hypothetical protein
MTKKLKIAAVLLPLMVWGGFNVFKESDSKIIKESYLKNDLKVGQVVRLKDLVKTSEGYLCILGEYQNSVRNVYDAQNEARVNAYLDELFVGVDEREVGLIISDSHSVVMSVISESLFGNWGFFVEENTKMIQLPTGFDVKYEGNCISLNVATIIKIVAKNGEELILAGEIK